MAEKTDFERVVDAIAREMDDEQDTDFEVGQQAVHRHGERRRVVWVWTGGTIEPPGPVQWIPDPDGNHVPVLHANNALVQAHIQAPNLRELELLWAAVLNATRSCLATASVPGAYEVQTQLPREHGHAYGGIEYLVQLFTWNMVVAKRTDILTNVTAVTHSCGIDLDL